MLQAKPRTRLLYIEYQLLSAIDSGVCVFAKNKGYDFKGLNGKPTPNTVRAVDTLIDRELIELSKGITEKGRQYLENYPEPKIKHPKLIKINKSDIDCLKKLNDSKLDWTASRMIANKASDVFKLVRYGYAVGRKNSSLEKLSKDKILPTPSLVYAVQRDSYFFKITKKGKDFLKSQ